MKLENLIKLINIDIIIFWKNNGNFLSIFLDDVNEKIIDLVKVIAAEEHPKEIFTLFRVIGDGSITL